jgi:hypothetical protein
MYENINFFILAGLILQIFGIGSYIKDTVSGKTKPNRVTWLIWAIAPIIGSSAAFSDGVTWAAFPVFMAGFCPLLVFIASFVNKNAYWKLEKFDYLCGVFSILALVLWYITKDPVMAVLFSIISDGLAAIPTIVKLWRYPDTENVWPFILGIPISLTSFTAITTWTFTSYAFPAYLVMIAFIQTGAFYRKKMGRFVILGNGKLQ